MATLTRFRDLLWFAAVQITWLQGTWGKKWRGYFDLRADEDADSCMAAVRSGWLRHADSPDDALPYIGEERGMPAYSAESSDQHRERLLGAWEAYQWAGSEQAIIEQLMAFGFTPTLSTVPGLASWTRDGVTLETASGPRDDSMAFLLTEDTSTGAHEIYTTVTDVPTDKLSEVRFLARCDADRLWLRVAIGSDYVYVNTGSRALGATVAPGGDATVRGFTTPGWVVVRARFWMTSASQTVRVSLADADESASYAGSTSYSVTIADMTVGTPEPAIIRANENDDPEVPDYWSQFWVVVPEGSHGYTSSIPSEDQAAIYALAHQWKPVYWLARYISFVTGGVLPVMASGLTADEWAALLNPEDNTSLEVSLV